MSYHELLGSGPYPTGPLTMWYRAVFHELPDFEPYCTEPSTMWYWEVYHVLPARGHVILSRGSRVTGTWTILSKAILYSAVFHELPDYRAANTFYWAVEHQVPWFGRSCTVPTTMCYVAMYHVLPGRGHIIPVRRTSFTGHSAILHWTSTIWYMAVYHELR